MENLAKYIDHTNLKVDAKKEDIIKLCDEAKKYGFYSVCVNPVNVKLAKENLINSNVKVASVIGFPLGESKTEVKVMETKLAIADGADEIDMVLSISRLVDGDYDYVYNDIKSIVELGTPVKVIFETNKLSDEQIIKATEICIKAGATFIKTSTGFLGDGANEHVVKLMVDTANGRVKVKASGGIRDYKTALTYVNIGASRLGTSSGVKIVTEE